MIDLIKKAQSTHRMRTALHAGKTQTRREFLKGLTVTGGILGVALLGCPVKGSKSGGGSSSGGGGGATTGALNFEINFSSAMNTVSVNDAISVSPNDPAFAPDDLVWSNADKTVTYSKTGYDGGATYTITIDGSVAKDADGNLLDGDSNGTAGGNYAFATA